MQPFIDSSRSPDPPWATCRSPLFTVLRPDNRVRCPALPFNRDSEEPVLTTRAVYLFPCVRAVERIGARRNAAGNQRRQRGKRKGAASGLDQDLPAHAMAVDDPDHMLLGAARDVD